MSLKRMISAAWQGLVEAFRRNRFERGMRAMAADPALRRESVRITEEFRSLETEGL